MITDRYYFQRLSTQEKAVYTALYKGIIAHDKEIMLPDEVVSVESVQRVFHAVTHDNPYLYYFNQTHMDFSVLPYGSVLMPQYFCTKEQVADYNGRIQDCVNQLVAELELLQCTDVEKEKRIHDYLCRNVVYDYDALRTSKVNRIVAAHSIIGVFARKRAVCEGIAKAVKLLLNTVDVGCIVASGTASLHNRGEHSWNIVKVCGRAYHLDATWDMSNSKNGYVNYDYFNVPDEAIRADHFDYGNMPPCSSWDENYFYRSKLVFSNLKKVERYIVSGMTKGVTSYYFKILDEGHKMSDIAANVRKFMLIEASNRNISATVSTSYNEEQRTARVTLKLLS